MRIVSFDVRFELCHLVFEFYHLMFGSNCIIRCSVQIVSFSVQFKLCHLVFGSNRVI